MVEGLTAEEVMVDKTIEELALKVVILVELVNKVILENKTLEGKNLVHKTSEIEASIKNKITNHPANLNFESPSCEHPQETYYATKVLTIPLEQPTKISPSGISRLTAMLRSGSFE